MRLSTGTQRRLRITPRGSRRTALVPLLTAALLVVAAPAWAYWATLATGTGTAETASLSAPAPVTVVAGAGTAHLAWAASTLSTGAPVSGYYVTRSGQTTPVCGSASNPVTGTSCDDTNLRPGSYTWTVTAVYRTWTASAVSSSATVTAGAPATVSVSSGSGQSARVGTAFSAPLVAVVRDGGGNPVPGASVTFTAAVGGPSGAFPGAVTVSVTTDAGGLATAPTFTANAMAGSYGVSATTNGVATPASFQLTNTAGAPSAVSVSSGSPQSVAVGSAFSPLVAKVVDAYNNPVPGVLVAFSAPTSGATGTFTGATATATSTTGADGLATAPTLTANTTAGSYAVSATAAGVATPASFQLTNTAGAARTISMFSGSPQSATVGAAFASALVAKVVDASGNPVSGVRVTFTAAGSGTPPASGTFANGTITTDAFTDATGKATASAFTANWAAGSYTVTATTSGVSGGASFALTNLAGPSPTFTSVSPSALVHGTSKTLVVTGANFRPGVTVTFSNKAIGVQSVTWVSDTEIDVAVTVASNVNGNNSNITITNLDGTSASKGNVIDMS